MRTILSTQTFLRKAGEMFWIKAKVRSIPKSVMDEVRVSQLVISKTRLVSPARKLRSVAGFPHISPWEMYHARPVLHTVFSTTQLGNLITQFEFMPSWF
jgi:hypothetical protein